jgi:hypothetical protein
MVKTIFTMVVGYGGGLMFTTMAIQKAAAIKRAKNWLSTRGRVLESTVIEIPERRTSEMRVRYKFDHGETIEGSTPRLSGDVFASKSSQAAFVSRFVEGQDVEVFFNPMNPHENCLDRTDKSGIANMAVLALILFVIGVGITWSRFFMH